MQASPVLSSDSKAATRETPAGAHLPFARHLDDATILTRDGYLMQTIRVGGLLFETADSGELNYRAELRDAMLRAIGTSRFAVYHHIIRRRVDADLAGEFSDAFSRKLDVSGASGGSSTSTSCSSRWFAGRCRAAAGLRTASRACCGALRPAPMPRR